MARRKESARCLGPYGWGDRWRIIEVTPNGDKERQARYFKTKAQAKAYKKLYEEALVDAPDSVGEALEEYEDYLRNYKGNKEVSVYQTLWIIRKMLKDEWLLSSLTLRRCQKAYDELVESGASVATHRSALSQVKTFLNFCIKRDMIKVNMCLTISGVGKRRKGKKQLRIKDARRWYHCANEQASRGVEGSIAALMSLLLGLRASEITGIKIGALDEDEAPFDVVHITDAKTEKGERSVDIPEPLRTYVAAIVGDRCEDEWLFHAKRSESGRRDRDWVRHQVKRICRAVDVEEVTAHGMRGMLATIALERGAMGSLVADHLGHEDEKMTRSVYAKKGAGDSASRRKGVEVLNRKPIVVIDPSSKA